MMNLEKLLSILDDGNHLEKRLETKKINSVLEKDALELVIANSKLLMSRVSAFGSEINNADVICAAEILRNLIKTLDGKSSLNNSDRLLLKGTISNMLKELSVAIYKEYSEVEFEIDLNENSEKLLNEIICYTFLGRKEAVISDRI